MGRVAFIWDLADDLEGNYWHICVEGHGVTREEVEEVVVGNDETATRSRSSGQPEAFGWTASGKYVTVVFERVSDDPLTVYPITAYEVPPPGPRNAEEEAMRDDQGKEDQVRPKAQWTAEDRSRHQAIRDMFRDWHPSPEELIASGEGANFDLHGEYRELRPFVAEIKRVREAAGLTLAEVSRRCGIDQPALSRLENGHNKNPTLDTLWRYAAAVGRRLVLTTEAIRDTRPAQDSPKRGAQKRARSR
jgi:DNA-binding XRE family transcriptional regulator